MFVCTSCGKQSTESSRFCDQCGTRLPAELPAEERQASPAEAPYVAPREPEFRSPSATSAGLPPRVEPLEAAPKVETSSNGEAATGHARLIIERGEAANTEFILTADESYIGRWDADNGIFPDVDLDSYDPDAKVSRKHARIIRGASTYMIEDLGSTNGTFINRGRRLLPGTPQVITEGDEIIVGKTFLRFHVNR